MLQVINGEIKQFNLPKVGTLKNGRTVSGYHLLPEETLKQEGWLPLEDIKPEYDEETQYLINEGYEILEDKAIKKYRVEDIPEPIEPIEPEPSEMDILNERLDMQDMVIEEILFDIIPSIGGMGGE